MKKRLIGVFAILLFFAVFAASFVSADIGPHTAARLDFHVAYNNSPIEEDFNAKIVACWDEGNCSLEADDSTICEDSVCAFVYYTIERVPSQMKLVVNLNGEDFSSDIINFSVRKPLSFYDVNILPDDEVIVTPSLEQENQINLFLWLPFIGALLLTIAIELIVSIIMLKKWKISSKKWKKPLLTVAIADIISVPAVWIIFLLVLALSSILASIIISEAFAVVFEAYALFLFNKKILPLKKSFTLSITMNLISFIIGSVVLTALLSLI